MIKYILNLFGLSNSPDHDMLIAENCLLKTGLSTMQDALVDLKSENDLLRQELSKAYEEDRLIKEQLLQELDLLLLQQTDVIGEA
jgi:uncharacterized protein (DUF3084 family)